MLSLNKRRSVGPKDDLLDVAVSECRVDAPTEDGLFGVAPRFVLIGERLAGGGLRRVDGPAESASVTLGPEPDCESQYQYEQYKESILRIRISQVLRRHIEHVLISILTRLLC